MAGTTRGSVVGFEDRQGGLSMEQTQMFQLTDSIKQRENIIVFGVGGGGGNALNHIINSGLEGVEFVAIHIKCLK